MALTPEQIAKLRTDAGLSPELPGQTNGPSQDVIQKRLAEFDAAVAPEPTLKKTGLAGLISKGEKSNLADTGLKDSLLADIGKNAANTLVVRPTVRTTEAVTRLLAPKSDAAKGYEMMADEGQPQNIGGIEVKPVKPAGQGGVKQTIGEALETASYLFPYGKVSSGIKGLTGSRILGNTIAGATGGYSADVGLGLQEGEKTSDAVTPGAGTIIGGAIPLVGPVTRGLGRGISRIGAETVEAVIPKSSTEAKILQAYKAQKPFLERISDVLKGTEKAPTTAGVTATRTTAGQTLPGLFGTKSGIGVQAKRATQSLWEEIISPRLKASKNAVDLDGFFSKVESDIKAKNPELSRQKSLLEALDAVKDDYDGVHSVSLEKLQKLKEGWAKFVPDKAYKGKPIGGAFNDVRNELAGEARNTIYTELGDDVKQAYFDYGNLKGLEEYGQKSMTGEKLKGGAGGFLNEALTQLITPIGTLGGQVVYRLGNGIEIIGNAGSKTLGEALGINIKKLTAVESARSDSEKD